MLIVIHDTLHEYGSRVIVFQEFLHLLGKFLSGFTSDSVDTHSAGQFHEIGIGHLCMRETRIVEESYDRITERLESGK